MKNSLSLILYSLQDAVSSAPGVKAWGQGVKVIEQLDDPAHGQVWWVHDSKDDATLSTEDILELTRGGYLTSPNGTPESKRFGRLTRKAYGVLAAKLRKGAEAVERSATQVQILTQRNRELERDLRIARETSGAALDMARFLEQVRVALKAPAGPSKVAFRRTKPPRGKANAGVPTLFCSDWHVGEVVQPERIEFLNQYNIEIARERGSRVFNAALEVLLHHQSGMSYDGMVVSFGGDMFSGNVHEELRVTNDKPIHECLLDLTSFLADSLISVADEFPSVYVPAVAGNHGRIDIRPTAKNASVDNYDYLLYRMVEMQVRAKMGSRCNISFDVSTALDLQYSLYGTRYLLTHGDQLKTSTNSDEFWPQMIKMASRKQERSAVSAGRSFDYMTVGHFHKYGTASNIIVNGSLKGYCEWVYKMNYAYDRPIQALWVTHPDHKITSHIPIYGDEPEVDRQHNMPPITTSAGTRKSR